MQRSVYFLHHCLTTKMTVLRNCAGADADGVDVDAGAVAVAVAAGVDDVP